MPAGNITVNELLATIEVDENTYKAIFGGGAKGGGLLNIGSETVFITTGMDALVKDGAQRDGEIPLAPGDSMPLPNNASFIRYAASTGKVSKLIYIAQYA